MGEKGKETVRDNFLITRLLLDYLNLLNDVASGRSGEATSNSLPRNATTPLMFAR